MKELTIDLQNYPADAAVFHRTAVRGIIRRGDNYLLIDSKKYGDCKFPGGGAEAGETRTETLMREVREEAGRDVLPETVREALLVRERRLGARGDVLFMDSYYYFCEVSDTVHPQQLQGYELDEGYEVVWMTLADAIARNEKISGQAKTPWVLRETTVMRALMQQDIIEEKL